MRRHSRKICREIKPGHQNKYGGAPDVRAAITEAARDSKVSLTCVQGFLQNNAKGQDLSAKEKVAFLKALSKTEIGNSRLKKSEQLDYVERLARSCYL